MLYNFENPYQTIFWGHFQRANLTVFCFFHFQRANLTVFCFFHFQRANLTMFFPISTGRNLSAYVFQKISGQTSFFTPQKLNFEKVNVQEL